MDYGVARELIHTLKELNKTLKSIDKNLTSLAEVHEDPPLVAERDFECDYLKRDELRQACYCESPDGCFYKELLPLSNSYQCLRYGGAK